jgi:hypothetical protein
MKLDFGMAESLGGGRISDWVSHSSIVGMSRNLKEEF